MESYGEDVRTQVMNALHWDLAVPRYRVAVEIKDGWVTMSGQVDLPYQRQCAESDVRHVPGVLGVINRIRISNETAQGASSGVI
jgi:osmotically-inducible protein OsmY